MAIELERGVRDTAIASIQRYFDQNMEERIGNIAAGALCWGSSWKRSDPASITRRSRICRSGFKRVSPNWTWRSTKRNSPTGASMNQASQVASDAAYLS